MTKSNNKPVSEIVIKSASGDDYCKTYAVP